MALTSSFQEYGSLANCPDYVTGQIVEMEAMSQSEVSSAFDKSFKEIKTIIIMALTQLFIIFFS